VPEWGRTRVRNVFDNIQAPIRLINALLQLKMHKFGAEFAKFVLNSTVVLPVYSISLPDTLNSRPAERIWARHSDSMDLARGSILFCRSWGLSSLRDTAGKVGDSFLDPIGYITPLRDAVLCALLTWSTMLLSISARMKILRNLPWIPTFQYGTCISSTGETKSWSNCCRTTCLPFPSSA